ncbi:EXS family-domain-containing protein [Lipomyces arxii]|uniref:EXS family-domain-containing protein n=1 Tax=Lipomyces arxii TaxID=56418 RepID=UPI0034CD06C4
MKFARYLSDNLVPEWRVQYLDYKGGKKRLKKLAKASSSSNKSPSSLSRSSTVPDSPQLKRSSQQEIESGAFGLRINDEDAESIKRTTPHELLTAVPIPQRRRDTLARNWEEYGSLIATPPQAAFILPSPALGDTENQTHPLTRSVTFEPDRFPDQDNLPPLQLGTPALSITENAKRSGLRNQSNGEVTAKSERHGSILRKQTQFESPALSTKSSNGSKANKRLIVTDTAQSAFDMTRKRMAEDESYREFIEWLDSEFDKVQTFYRQKEENSVVLFNKIREQLHVLRDQKMREREQMFRLESTVRLSEINSGKVDKPKKTMIDKVMIQWKAFHRKLNLHHLPFVSKPEPTLPSSNSQRDYARHQATNTVTYRAARRKLKHAVMEYYRGLELLKSYRLLNRIGMQKITKKFDKTTSSYISGWYGEKVNSSYFGQSNVVDNLMNETEDVFSRYFEHGNHKNAVEKLRTREQIVTYYTPTFFTGTCLGLGLPLFIQALVIGIRAGLHDELANVTFIFQIFGGGFLIILFSLLFGVNCMVWSKYKINYPFVFEFDQHNFLNYREFMEIPSFLFFWLSLCMYLCFSNFFPTTMPAHWWPLLFVSVSVALVFMPLPVFNWRAREWLVIALWRLCLGGLYPVEFRDFFLGDIFCSLTYSVSNIELFFCLYARGWRSDARCGSAYSRAMGFLNALPPIWRFLQCLRRYRDTQNWFPHLANACKYLFTIATAVVLSVWRIDRTHSNRNAYIVFAVLNTVYSAFWDLFMDWSLFQTNSKYWLLRNELGFRNPKVYYAAMVIDPLLRANWIFYVVFPVQLQQSAALSFLIALVEVIRRFVWIFFRMENEHCSNVGRSVASRDMPLPYDIEELDQELEEINVRTPLMAAQGTVSDISAAQPSPMAGTPSTMRRRRSTLGAMTPRMVASVMSSALRGAHVQDFERRKKTPRSGSIAVYRDFDSDEDVEEEDDGDHDPTEVTTDDEDDFVASPAVMPVVTGTSSTTVV